MTDRLTIRLGPLASALSARCQQTGESPVNVARAAIAKELGVEAPEMAAGNPNIAEESTKGVKARWGKKRQKK